MEIPVPPVFPYPNKGPFKGQMICAFFHALKVNHDHHTTSKRILIVTMNSIHICLKDAAGTVRRHIDARHITELRIQTTPRMTSIAVRVKNAQDLVFRIVKDSTNTTSDPEEVVALLHVVAARAQCCRRLDMIGMQVLPPDRDFFFGLMLDKRRVNTTGDAGQVAQSMLKAMGAVGEENEEGEVEAGLMSSIRRSMSPTKTTKAPVAAYELPTDEQVRMRALSLEQGEELAVTRGLAPASPTRSPAPFGLTAIEKVTVRPRLVRFYRKYNPSRLAALEEILDSAESVVQLFDSLVERYGPEPPVEEDESIDAVVKAPPPPPTTTTTSSDDAPHPQRYDDLGKIIAHENACSIPPKTGPTMEDVALTRAVDQMFGPPAQSKPHPPSMHVEEGGVAAGPTHRVSAGVQTDESTQVLKIRVDPDEAYTSTVYFPAPAGYWSALRTHVRAVDVAQDSSTGSNLCVMYASGDPHPIEIARGYLHMYNQVYGSDHPHVVSVHHADNTWSFYRQDEFWRTAPGLQNKPEQQTNKTVTGMSYLTCNLGIDGEKMNNKVLATAADIAAAVTGGVAAGISSDDDAAYWAVFMDEWNRLMNLHDVV